MAAELEVHSITRAPQGSTFKTIRKLDLPQGRWTVLAKLWFEGAAMPVTPVYDRTASCLLEFGADKDRAQVRYGNNISRFDPLVLSVAHTSHSDEPVKLKCRRTNVPGTGKVYFIKITALRAGPLTKRHRSWVRDVGGPRRGWTLCIMVMTTSF